MKHSPELQAALDAAEKAAAIARSLYQRNIEVRIKADKSPVTEADVRCEMAIREILEARFPAYGFYGEETGSRDAEAESLWLVDPIDGTKAFVREYPMFSTQIALMRRGEIVLGVSSAPVYGELSFAERGRGAYSQRQAPGRERNCRHRCGRTVVRQHEEPGRGPNGRAMARWLRGSTAFAATAIFCTIICWRREDRCRDRNRHQYSRYRRLRGDRQRGGRPVHGFERRSHHAPDDVRARHQRAMHAPVLAALG